MNTHGCQVPCLAGAAATLASLVELAHAQRAGPTLLARGSGGVRAADAATRGQCTVLLQDPVSQSTSRVHHARSYSPLHYLSSVLHTRSQAQQPCMYRLTLYRKTLCIHHIPVGIDVSSKYACARAHIRIQTKSDSINPHRDHSGLSSTSAPIVCTVKCCLLRVAEGACG
jgi:hypothetical protein